MKKLLIILMPIILISCKPNLRIKWLTNNNEKYWDQYDVKNKMIVKVIRISKNNTAKYYLDRKEGRTEYPSTDVIIDTTWSLRHDFIRLEGLDFKILQFTPDTIVLTTRSNDSFLLMKSKKQSL